MSYRLRVFKNTYFSSMGLYVEYGIGLVTSIIMARTLGPSDYGTYALAVWIVSLALTVAQGAINQGIIKFVAEARGNDDMGQVGAVMNYFSRVLKFNIIIIMAAVGVGLWHFGPSLIPLENPLWLVVPWAAIAVRTTYMYLIGVGKGFEDFRAIARVALIVSPLYLVVTLIAGWLSFSVEQFLVVFLAFGVLFCTVTWFQMRQHLNVDADAELDSDTQRRMRRHLFIVTARVVFAFLASSQVEILLLGMLESQADVGLFRVAKRMAGGLALLIPGMFMAVMLPVMSRTIGEGGEAMIRRYRAFLRYVFIAAAPLACFGALFATPIIVFLYGGEYAAAGMLFAVILAVDSIGFLSGSANSFLVSVDRQLTILYLVFTATILKLGLGYVLIQKFGLLGAIGGYTLMGVSMSMTMMTIAQRHLGVRFEWRRFVLIASSALLSLVPVLPLFQHFTGLSGVLIAAPIYGITYGLAILYSGCLSSSDIGLLREVRQKWLPAEIPMVDALLKRARHT